MVQYCQDVIGMKYIIQKGNVFKTIFPKKNGYPAFYFKVNSRLWFRVYKVEHLFSTVGVAHFFVLHISFRHLQRLKQFKWADKRMISFECDVDTGINILKELEQMGKVDISFLFKD